MPGECSPTSGIISELIEEFLTAQLGEDSGATKDSATRSLTYCFAGGDGIFHRDWRNAKDALKIGSLDSAVHDWLLDADGKCGRYSRTRLW